MSITNEFRIIRDHLKLKIIRKTRPLTIHTEAIYNEDVWRAVKAFVNSGKKAVWYVLAPTNLDYVRVHFDFRGRPEEYERTILKRYKWLAEHGQEIQLHVHLLKEMYMYGPRSRALAEQKKKISDAVEWMRANGFDVKKIVFGWWMYDRDSVAIAAKLGLKTIKRTDFYFIHDFDLPYLQGSVKPPSI